MLCSTGGPGYPTLYVDESGKMRQSWADAFGRTIELDEPNNSGTLAVNTCYTYDQLGDLTGVTQGAQTRSYSYDALSRLTTSVAPETTTNYTYLTANQTLCSGNPNLPCTRSDARRTPIDYAYDQLNRLTGITYTDGKTHAIGYTYDAGTNQRGFRTGMTDGSGSTTWTYFTNGWLQKEQRTIAGKTNTLSYTYNGDGTVAAITYPSGNVVTYGIGSDERSTTATDVTHNLNYVATASYMPPGELSSMIFGQATGFNGINNTAAFNSRLFFTGATASTSSVTAQSVSLSYNSNGTVSSMQNAVTSGLSESFTYDSLDRILSAATSASSGAGCWGQSFGPSGTPPSGPPDDRWSNLTEINVTQCTTSGLSVTASSATNQVTTAGYGYDVVGNMTADGRTGYAYSFDAENHMTQASGTPSGTWTYTYDGNGLRVEKTNGTSGTLYWRNLAGNTIAETDLTGSTTDSAYREYIFFAGQRVAQRDATTPTPNVYFYYSDRVGSTTTITTATGTPCYQATFTPYGQEMATQATCSTNYKLAGYERDAETGFDYAFARYYNSTLGRFVSPDPLAGDVSDPQTLNRYAYVENSPTNFVDPNGTHVCDAPVLAKYAALGTSCEGSDGVGGDCTVNSGLGLCGNFFWNFFDNILFFAGGGLTQAGIVSDSSIQSGQFLTLGGQAVVVSIGDLNVFGGGTALATFTIYPDLSSAPSLVPLYTTGPVPPTRQKGADKQTKKQDCVSGVNASGTIAGYPVTQTMTLCGAMCYSDNGDISVSPSVGLTQDTSINAPDGYSQQFPGLPAPLLSVGVGLVSLGTWSTDSGMQGVQLSLGPSVGPPVSMSFTVRKGSGCGG
jgi:RHS repeat-associated protein